MNLYRTSTNLHPVYSSLQHLYLVVISKAGVWRDVLSNTDIDPSQKGSWKTNRTQSLLAWDELVLRKPPIATS